MSGVNAITDRSQLAPSFSISPRNFFFPAPNAESYQHRLLFLCFSEDDYMVSVKAGQTGRPDACRRSYAARDAIETTQSMQ